MRRKDSSYLKVVDLVKALGYVHPIELLTCFFCIFGCNEILNASTEFLQNNCEALRKFRIENKKTHLVELHPTTFLKRFGI